MRYGAPVASCRTVVKILSASTRSDWETQLYIATWQKTILGRDHTGGLIQIDLETDISDAISVMDENELSLALNLGRTNPINVVRSEQYLHFQCGDSFLCASDDRVNVFEDRDFPGPWETFILVSHEDVDRYLVITRDDEAARLRVRIAELSVAGKPVKIHFAPGSVPIDGFINIDVNELAPVLWVIKNSKDYFLMPFVGERIDLPENCIDYIFHEDFLEHIDQIGQIQFLAETLRILKPGSYHRVNTPDLMWTMRTHSDFSRGSEGVYTGELQWEHIGLLSRDHLRDLARMIGYDTITFNSKGGGISPYAVPDRRPRGDRDEVEGNIYADLRKSL